MKCKVCLKIKDKRTKTQEKKRKKTGRDNSPPKYKMVLKYMKEYVIVKEMSIKTQRYHFLSIRLAKNRKYNTFCS